MKFSQLYKSLGGLFLAFCFTSSFAQNIVVFQQTQQQNILINNNYVQMTRNDMTRQVLQGLSSDIPKNIYTTEFTVNFNYDLRLVQVSSTMYGLTFSKKNTTVNGDVSISSFRIDDVLIPDMYSFDIQIVMPGGMVHWSQHYQDVQATTDGLILNLNNYDNMSMAGAIVRILNLQLAYSQHAFTDFTRRMQLIRSYRSSNPQYFVRRLKQLPWGNIDSIAVIRQVYDQATAYNREMASANLQQLGSDPEGKIQAFTELSKVLEEYDQQMNIMNADAPGLYYKKGLDQMALGNLEGATRSFNLCLGNNKMSHPSAFFMLAKIDYLQGRYDSSWEKLAGVHDRVPNDIQVDMLRLGSSLFDTYISQAKGHIKKKQYKEAIDKVTKARNPCFTLNFSGCSDTADRYNRQAWQGIYNQLIAEATAAMKISNFVMAEEKANDAKRTARNNPKEIPDSKKADEILGKLKQSEYDNLIKSGKVDMTSSDKVEQALFSFQGAKDLESKYTVVQNAELPKLLKSVQRTVSIKKLNALKANLSSLNMGDARKQYDAISLEIISAGLEGDAEIKKVSAEMSTKLGKKECDDAAKEVENKTNDAKGFEKNLNYTEAIKSYDAAVVVALKEKHCRIDTSNIMTQRRRITPALKYESLLSQALKDLKDGAYNNVIEDIDNALAYHKTQQLDTLGIPFVDKIEWAIQNNDAQFHYYLSDYYHKKNQIDNAFQMLKSSLSLGMVPILTYDMQTILGKEMAIKDNKSRGNSPEVWVAHYISEGEKELKQFKKSYLKEWKKLEKAKKKKK